MLFAFILAGLLLPSLLGAAQHPPLVLNEVAWMGTPVGGADKGQWWRYEWVELYNPGVEVVELNGWTVEFSREDIDLLIPLEGSVPAQGYFVAGASDLLQSVDLNYANLGGRMHNDGQRVVLRNPEGQAEEELDMTSGWVAGDNEEKLTMERRFAEREAGDPANWGTSRTIGGTPGAQNSIEGTEPFRETKKDPAQPFFGDIAVFFNRSFTTALLPALAFAALAVLVRRRIPQA